MDDPLDVITLDYGDQVIVEADPYDPDESLAIRVQNGAFVERPRYIRCAVVGGDRARYLDELIGALEQLRDAK